MCNKKIATVLVPNYKTLKLTKVCLRLIKKNTDLKKVHVIVIDNDSKDDSTKYLRSLNWIELIERKGIKGEGGPMSHARALDLALTKVTTPFVIAIHTDTFVIHP
ncbi:MAG: glycosyltransferase family 2 protein, partial [Methylophilaceae bacterium]